MTTIFGYATIKDEIVSLINAANADYGSDFATADLDVSLGEFDIADSRQRFVVKDLSGKYFGIRNDVGVFKRNFQTLFRGITLHIQSGTGLKNSAILQILADTYGLEPFAASDFADGLLDLTTDVGDDEVLVTWPFASTSWSWTGNCVFYLRNEKSSLGGLITDDFLEVFAGNTPTGLSWNLRTTPLNGLYYPSQFDLDQVILTTDLEGLEYPGEYDLGSLITVTDLDGLDYPTDIVLDDLIAALDGLEYPPAVDLNALTVLALSGLDYPAGIGTSRYSALVLTRSLDFSDYQNAIQRFRIGENITDANLVSVIVGKIAANWLTMNRADYKANLTVAFTNATVQSITRTRSLVGWTETMELKPSANSFITGNAFLRYDIESTE